MLARHIHSGEWYDVNQEAVRLHDNIQKLKKQHKDDPLAQIIKAEEGDDNSKVFKEDRTWPRNSYLTIKLAQLEKHMRYYSVNYADLSSKKQHSSLSKALGNQSRYLEYLVDYTTGKISDYITGVIRQLMFDGKSVRNLNVELGYDSKYDIDLGAVLYSIEQIRLEKHTNRGGSVQRNIMSFELDKNGNVSTKELISESLPKKFNEETLAMIQNEISILLERFNCNISNLQQQLYDRSPESKAKMLSDIGDKNRAKFFSNLERLRKEGELI